ncbi:NAD/NADP transhydrogenase beta subunit [Catalinimonas alkaloidigena]|uniref:hypothetical protein n=1 Tax=Catalinimonas alkaloidigena TaxID=1075417 RepID=UPI002406D3BD|nr:hypothetical protein [Catalinimonas alkaloidigena]MDF9798213.1 NAD/NADP transhydrogenase beta subunit [Catalinimonas alkaloidigena]
MKINVQTVLILFFSLGSAMMSTQFPVDQQFSSMIALAMFFTFFCGLVTIYGHMSAVEKKSSTIKQSRKVLTMLNFACLLIICSTLGWIIGGVVVYSQTNFFAFSIMLYFLGLRLGAYLQFHLLSLDNLLLK